MSMRLPGQLVLVLKPGEARTHIHSQVDVAIGAVRPSTSFLSEPIDAALNRGEGFHAASVYHARSSLGRVGEQHRGFDDVEERLGLARTYSVHIADPARTQDVVNRLRELPAVESAYVQTLAAVPFATVAPLLAASAEEAMFAPHEQIRARDAHQSEPGDAGVWVGLVDTGISLIHPEFQRKLLAGYDTVRLPLGGNWGDLRLVGLTHGDDFAPRDRVGHGSHVGGIIGAHGWRMPPGIAGRCMLLPVRVLAAALDNRSNKVVGVGALPDINAGLKIAVDLGADVLNLSFGTPESAVVDGPRPHEDVIQYATHYGCTLVAAMGNSGRRETYYPARFDEVIAVGSVDKDDHHSRFSTTGDHVALCAPGEGIVSAGRQGYEAGSGTSYAAPFVTGAAALLVARARRQKRKLNGSEVKQLLVDSARPAAGDAFNPETGHGVLDVASALRRLDAALSSRQPPGSPL
jgi:subtilisin family serine protease